MVQTTFEELLEAGDSARRRQSLTEAEQAYQQALELAGGILSAGPDMTGMIPLGEVLVKLGRLYEAQHDTRASEAAYNRALVVFSQQAGDEYFDLAIARDQVAVPEIRNEAAA